MQVSSISLKRAFASCGSHWKITAADEEAILTIPAKRPIKPVYIRKLLAMIERRGDGETD
jgi:hypothetical protein